MTLIKTLFQVLIALFLIGSNVLKADDIKLQSHKGMGVKADVVGDYSYKDGLLTLNISKLLVFPHEIVDKPIYVRSLQFVVSQAKSVNELSSRYKLLCGSIPVDRKISHTQPFVSEPFTVSYNLSEDFNVNGLDDSVALKICLGTGEECGRHTWAYNVDIIHSDD